MNLKICDRARVPSIIFRMTLIRQTLVATDSTEYFADLLLDSVKKTGLSKNSTSCFVTE